MGISGNERADSAAKAALQKDVSDCVISYTDTYQYISQYICDLWQSEWDTSVKAVYWAPCCSHYMYNLLEILLENMDSAFTIMQMICNCMTILILVHPPLRVQYIDSKTVLQISKYGLMKIR